MDGSLGSVPANVLAALAGLAAGVMLGLAGRLGDFCTLAALETAVWGRDPRRLRQWGVVLGTAILGVQAGAALGVIDLGASYYHAIAWNPLASIAGGLVFGYGMALAGNCGFGALVRFGGGDIRSLIVVVVLGISAFITLSGPLGPLRERVFPQADLDPQAVPGGIAVDLAAWTGLPAAVFVAALAAGLLALGLRRAPPARAAWGVVGGLAVPVALAATSWIADHSLGAVMVEGLSYTAPVGRTILFLMTATAGGISFSIGAVLGTALGGFLGSLRHGLFRWEACEDPRELGRQVRGAALMGVGGTVAMGCSIGQGLTGTATLAWSGPVTLAAIVLGALVGLRRLID